MAILASTLFTGLAISVCAPQGTPPAPAPTIQSTHPVVGYARLLPADTALAVFVPATAPHVEALGEGPIHTMLGSTDSSLAVHRRVSESLASLAETVGIDGAHIAQVLASGFVVGWHGNTRLGDPKWTAVLDLADTTQAVEARIPELLREWQENGARVASEDWRGTMVHAVGQNDAFAGAFAVRGHTLVVAHDAAAVTQALRFQLQLAEGKPNLADTSEFHDYAATLPAPDATIATVWANPKNIHELVAPKINRETRGTLERTIAELGIDDLTSAGYSLAREEGDLVESVFLALPAPQRGLLGALFRAPSTDTEPPSRVGILTATAHPAWRAVFDSAVELAAGLDRGTMEDFVAWEADVADRTGVSFRSDLISLLGDQTSIWAYAPGEDGSDRFAMAVRLRDVWAFQQSFERIQTEFAAPVTLDPIGEFQCYRVNLRGIASDAQPRFGIHNGSLVVTVGVRSMHEWLMNLQPASDPASDPSGDPAVPAPAPAPPPPVTAAPSLVLTADLTAWLPRLLDNPPALTADDVGEVSSQLTANAQGLTWTTRSAIGNPLLWALIDAYDDLSGSELRNAVQPAPEPIAAEPVPTWNPANTLHALRHLALEQKNRAITDADADGTGEFVGLDELFRDGEGLPGATFLRPGIWMLDTHLIQVLLPAGTDARETQCAIVAWPAFEATGMVYAVLASGPVMANDLMAEVAGLTRPEPHDLFVDGIFGGEFTAGWQALGIDPTDPADVAIATEQPDADPERDARSLAVLEERGERADTESIVSLTASTNASVAARATWLLGELRRKDAIAPLQDLTLHHAVVDVRRQAVHSLYRLGDPGSVPTCIAALDDADEQVRTMAAATLGRLRNKQALEPLMDFLATHTQDGGPDEGSGRDVTQALLSLRDLNSPDCLRGTAAATGKLDKAGGEALAYLFQELSPQLGEDEAATLIGTLEHPCSLLRRYSIQRLGEIGDQSAATALEKRIAIESAELQDLVTVSIQAIRGDTTTPDNPLLEVREKTLDLWDRAVARWKGLNDNQRYVAMGGAGAVVLIIIGLVFVLRRRRHAQAADDAVAFLDASEGFEQGEHADEDGVWDDDPEDIQAEEFEPEMAEAGGPSSWDTRPNS